MLVTSNISCPVSTFCPSIQICLVRCPGPCPPFPRTASMSAHVDIKIRKHTGIERITTPEMIIQNTMEAQLVTAWDCGGTSICTKIITRKFSLLPPHQDTTFQGIQRSVSTRTCFAPCTKHNDHEISHVEDAPLTWAPYYGRRDYHRAKLHEDIIST